MEPVNISECHPATANNHTSGYLFFAFLLNGPITTSVVVFGCIGNIYSIFLLTSRLSIRKTVIMYLVTLAIWDTIVLCCSFAYYSFGAYVEWYRWNVEQFVNMVTVNLHPYSSISMTASVWMLMVITSERHLAIWKPLRHRVIDRTRRARFICVFFSVLAVLYNIPTFLELHNVPCYLPSTKTLSGFVDGTPLRLSPTYQLVYRVIIALVFQSLVPFILVLVLTIHMIKMVKQATASRNQMLSQGLLDNSKNREKKERNTTLMLLALALKFLFCQFLPTALNIWEKIFLEPPPFPITFLYVVEVSNFLVVLNSATNCVVYFRCKDRLKRITKKRSTLAIRGHYSDSGANYSMINFQTKIQSDQGTAVSRCCSPAVAFQPHEAKILRQIWRDELRNAQTSVGLSILTGLIRKKPILAIQFEILPDTDLKNLEDSPELIEQGQKMTSFFDQVINAAGDLNAENRAADSIRDVGRKHFDRGINFNNEIWCEFRSVAMQFLPTDCQHRDNALAIENYGTSESPPASAHLTLKMSSPQYGDTQSVLCRAWTRVICFIIREMKQGFLAAALQSND